MSCCRRMDAREIALPRCEVSPFVLANANARPQSVQHLRGSGGMIPAPAEEQLDARFGGRRHPSTITVRVAATSPPPRAGARSAVIAWMGRNGCRVRPLGSASVPAASRQANSPRIRPGARRPAPARSVGAGTDSRSKHGAGTDSPPERSAPERTLGPDEAAVAKGIRAAERAGQKRPGHQATARGYPMKATMSIRAWAITSGITRPHRR